MDLAEARNHDIATAAWSGLLIWWGAAIMIGPVTIGMTAMGTGLILLGANAARSLMGIEWRRSTTEIGVVALVWGALDHFFSLPIGFSFAMLLILIGLKQSSRLLIGSRTS